MAKSGKGQRKKHRDFRVTYTPIEHSDEALANILNALKVGITGVQQQRDKKSANGGPKNDET